MRRTRLRCRALQVRRLLALSLSCLVLCGWARSSYAQSTDVLTSAAAQRLFHALAHGRDADGCKLDSVNTRVSRVQVTWTRDGQRASATLAPRQRGADAGVRGRDLALHASPALAKLCPHALAKLTTLVTEQSFVTRVSQSNTWGGPPRLIVWRGTLAWTALAASLALLLVFGVGFWRRKRWLEAWRTARSWWLLGLGTCALALGVRAWLQPGMANWYAEVLPPRGTTQFRFGPGARVIQEALRAVAPWTDTTLFVATAVVGALAIPVVVAICYERRIPWLAAAATGLLFALSPLHARASVSGSEHVFSSTFTLLALLTWMVGVRLRSWRALVLALTLVVLISLVRAEAWPQLLALPVMSLCLDRLERAQRGERALRPRAQLAAFFPVWGATGAFVFFAVVIPSHHPGPVWASCLYVAKRLFTQYWTVAFATPHWISPVAVLLALPGLAWMLWRRPWLLAGVTLSSLVAFASLGRNFEHDQLLGARYFLAMIPLFQLVSGFGLLAAARGLERLVGGRSRWAVDGLVLAATGAVSVAWTLGAYRQRFTFEAEYAFLAQHLADLPAGCTVNEVSMRDAAFEHDLDCCLDAAHSPLIVRYPKLHFRELTTSEAIPHDAGCQAYYESAACSLRDTTEVRRTFPRAKHALDAFCRRAARMPASVVGQETITGHSTNDMFDHKPPSVRLLRWR